jgi:hypothetical protein
VETLAGRRDRRLVDDIFFRMTEKQGTIRIVQMEIARYSPATDGARIGAPRLELDQRSEAFFDSFSFRSQLSLVSPGYRQIVNLLPHL